VPGRPVAAEPGSAMQCLYQTSDRTVAQLLRGHLEALGIGVFVQGEHLFALQGQIPVGAAFELRVCVVDDEQLPQATRLTRNWLERRASPQDAPPWVCRGCGERHEPQFAACWRCGADADAA